MPTTTRSKPSEARRCGVGNVTYLAHNSPALTRGARRSRRSVRWVAAHYRSHMALTRQVWRDEI